VADLAVQIHGGNGFVRGNAAERAYRDARVNRIFEGTNEINRLLASGVLLKRAQQGRLGLMPAIQALQQAWLAPGGEAGTPLLERARQMVLLAMGSAARRGAGAGAGDSGRAHRPGDGALRNAVGLAAGPRRAADASGDL